MVRIFPKNDSVQKYIVRYEDITYRSDDRRLGYLYPKLYYYIIRWQVMSKSLPVVRMISISLLSEMV